MKKIKKFLSFVISLCVVMASVVIISQPKVVAGNWAGCSYSSGTLSVDISTSSTTISVTYSGSGKNYLGVQGYIYKLAATCNGSTSVGAEVDKAVAVAGKITSYSATSSWNASSWAPGTYTCTMTCYVVANNGATDSTSTSKTVTVTCSHSGGYTRKDTSSTYLKSAATCTSPAVYYYKCKNCTAKGTNTFTSGSTAAHNYTSTSTDSSHLKSAATCTSPAVYYKSCTVCGANDTSNTFTSGSSLGHSFTSQTKTSTYLKTAATCTADAVYYYKCSRCSTSSQGDTNTTYTDTGSMLAHTPGAAATCTTPQVCTVCGTTITPALTHDYSQEDTGVSHRATVATCTAPATYYYSCSRCGENGPETFTSGSADSSNHTAVDADWTTTVAATCTTDGTRVKYCQACHQVAASETITHSGHDYQFTRTVAATCTEGGYDLYTCANGCGSTENRNTTAALTHDYNSVVTSPTCTEDGYTTHTCSRCGDSYTDSTVTASGHSYALTSTTTPPTCTEAGEGEYTCSVCGVTKNDTIAALGHDWGEWTTTTPATCSATGTKTRTCQIDPNHTETDTIAIDPDAHNTDGVDWTVTVAPTTSSTGTKVKYCTLCGAVAESAEIPVITDPTAVAVSPNSSTVEVGSTTQLTLSTTPSDAQTSGIVWTSSDPTVATVSSTGLVTGVTTGAVMITATLSSDNTVTDSVSVTVVPAQSGDGIDVVNTNPDIDVNVGADTTSVTVTGTSCNASSDGTNTFNFSIALALSSTYTNTVVEENEIVAVITLDNNFAAPNGYRGVSGSTVYPAVADSVYIPLSAGSNVFSIVSPSYIQPDENGKVMWHVAVYLGGTVKAPKNELLYNSIIEFENSESGEATLAVSVIGDPLVSQSATTKNIKIDYENISSLAVAVEHQNPATGVYASVSALASPVTLTSSGQGYAITINGASAMTPGTTIRLTFTAYDSSHNVVATDKCYLVASWIN